MHMVFERHHVTQFQTLCKIFKGMSESSLRLQKCTNHLCVISNWCDRVLSSVRHAEMEFADADAALQQKLRNAFSDVVGHRATHESRASVLWKHVPHSDHLRVNMMDILVCFVVTKSWEKALSDAKRCCGIHKLLCNLKIGCDRAHKQECACTYKSNAIDFDSVISALRSECLQHIFESNAIANEMRMRLQVYVCTCMSRRICIDDGDKVHITATVTYAQHRVTTMHHEAYLYVTKRLPAELEKQTQTPCSWFCKACWYFRNMF